MLNVSDFTSFNFTIQQATPNRLARKHLSSMLHHSQSYSKGESQRAVIFVPHLICKGRLYMQSGNYASQRSEVIDLTNEHVAVCLAS